MEFPIVDLLSEEECEQWVSRHFHPDGLKCPRCGAGVEEAYYFRKTKRSKLTVYRCKHCLQPYNVYSRTVFEQRHLTPAQTILLLRGVLKGEPARTLAVELGLHEVTVLELRRDLQASAKLLQPDSPLPDQQTETDEMFQNAGEKRR